MNGLSEKEERDRRNQDAWRAYMKLRLKEKAQRIERRKSMALPLDIIPSRATAAMGIRLREIANRLSTSSVDRFELRGIQLELARITNQMGQLTGISRSRHFVDRDKMECTCGGPPHQLNCKGLDLMGRIS